MPLSIPSGPLPSTPEDQEGTALSVHHGKWPSHKISESANMLSLDEVLASSFAGSFENSRNSQEFPKGLTPLAWVHMATPL